MNGVTVGEPGPVFRIMPLAGAVCAAFLALAAPAMGAGPSLAMLDRLDAGNWEIRVREAGAQPQRMCLTSGYRLIQLRHPGPSCERVVVAAGANAVTVQYTCLGRGYGRTEIRRETNRLVQIDTQGIADGKPFSQAIEARRTAGC